jgi:hypothetical protein
MQRYEIFQKLPSKLPSWVESATSLEDAKNRWKELNQMFPGCYFILDSANSCFIVPIRWGPRNRQSSSTGTSGR